MNLDLYAKISGIKYKPLLCRNLKTYRFDDLEKALENDASFILELDGNQIAVSWWVSPKRTRSYPYARVYDTLGFVGKRVTIIPVMKDEGKDGDRDFLQWDTVSLMSLLGVFVIVSYYSDATKNPKFTNKITNQRFNMDHLRVEIIRLTQYQSDALHWNLDQIDKVSEIGKKALDSYKIISNKLHVEMHSFDSANRRLQQIAEGRKQFMKLSRWLAKEAQQREKKTKQSKENLKGTKASLTVENYLGGEYYFTCDEVEIKGDSIYLIEGKHSALREFPSLDDIKDGLLKMILLTNLQEVHVGGYQYKPVPVLKLTASEPVDVKQIMNYDEIKELCREASTNGFRITYNEKTICNQ